MLKVSTSYLWKAAKVLHPELWADCESGELPEHIVEDRIEWSLQETLDRINSV